MDRYAAASVEQDMHVRASEAVTHRPLGAPVTVIPATHAYELATEALILGRVVAVTDHRIAIGTESGERIALEMDSRTLVPTTLQSGMGVRVEYRAMENGVKLAKRVTPAHLEWAENRNVAYPPGEEEMEEPSGTSRMNSTASYHHEDRGAQMAANEREETPAEEARAAVMLRRHSRVG
ncbi:MAG: hypothetical protein E6K80_01610 [Candidatus Eisenbacteria bacterium]|uniref:Uncharacterized protein n=1 Tax=Eiseniibacteriota bacterium TaxID=2212470 RepID=A0A538UAJ7_UNCEI|nr:MAG: hypothetical protein E6K80_01610 [Candidatus Eisenbacteria bacterium]